MKVAWAESPPLPDNVTMYDPAATPPTVNVPVGVPVPALIMHDANVTGVPESEHEVSAGRNPEPVTVTVTPMAPVDGERAIVGPVVTVKLAVAESPPLPDNVIV